MWRNNRDPQSDAWMPELNNSGSRAAVRAQADAMDERSRKFRVEEFSRLPPHKGRELPEIAFHDNEVERKFWMDRELQSQAIMSRKFSRSVKSSGKNTGVFRLERSSTGPRSGLLLHREEDSYSSQQILPVHKHNHRTRNELQIEDELYPVMSNTMDYPQAVFNDGYVGNLFGLRKGVDSQQAALEGAMTSYTPSYRNSQPQKFQSEGSFTGPYEYSTQSFSGGYSHPQYRFQESLYDHPPPYSRYQGGDRLFSEDSYFLQSSANNNAKNFPVPVRQHMAHPIISQREMSLCPDLNKCTCCKAHIPSHGSVKPYPLMQHPSLGYQHSQTHSYCQDYGNQRSFPSNSSKNSLRSLQVHRKVADPLSEAVQARKENAPPLPGPYAPPYVLCQGCDKIVQISTKPYLESPILRVRCSACRRVSKFCNIVHPCYQALFKEKKAANFLQQDDCVESFDKQKMPYAPAVVATLESKSTVQKFNLKPEGQSNGEHKQIAASESPIGAQYLSSLTPLQEQGVDETDGGSFMAWSRAETFHEDSSSLFSAAGSVSTNITAMHKLQESQQTYCNVHFVAPSAKEGEVVPFNTPSDEIDPILDQMNDKGLFSLSEDLQGLLLDCFQDGSHDNLTAKTKDGCTSLRSQSHQDTHHKPECFKDGRNQELSSSSPGEQTRRSEHSGSLKPGNESSHAVSLQSEKSDGHNQGSGHNLAKAFDDGLDSAARCPNAGSPLYEHLSYNSGSEIAEAVQNQVWAKQTTHVPLSRDTSKGSSFLANLLKRNMHLDNAGQGNNKNASVVVNGTMIPLDAVKIAEKRAGAIRPGVYWYDHEAGFWGVMGGPCLGIIPPFISEFKIPIAENCAGGTTNIFVNGRELHKKDLDVLAGRGLPRTPGKSYMVDISGQVVDKSSGQMLRSLGRLAPTIQKRGHGCGMFQPPRHS